MPSHLRRAAGFLAASLSCLAFVGCPGDSGSNGDGGAAGARGGAGGPAGAVGGAGGTARGAAGTAGGAAGAPAVGGNGGAGPSCLQAVFAAEYALRTDGILVWDPPTPTAVVDGATGAPLKGVFDVSRGGYSACAAVTGGAVYCWMDQDVSGKNGGQLGDGSFGAHDLFHAGAVLTAANTPLTGIVELARSDGERSMTACAVTGDGKLWCWGDLTYLLSDGGKTLLKPYAQVITTDGTTPLAGVIHAATGDATTCVILQGAPGTPNTLWCMGNGGGGERGVGTASVTYLPAQVTGVVNPTKVIISYGLTSSSTVCALDGGNVRCWGDNQAGEVGANVTDAQVASPMLVVTASGQPLDGVVDIAPGEQGIGALRNDGTIWSWGSSLQPYAAPSKWTSNNVVGMCWGGKSPHALTSEGNWHVGSSSKPADCGPL